MARGSGWGGDRSEARGLAGHSPFGGLRRPRQNGQRAPAAKTSPQGAPVTVDGQGDSSRSARAQPLLGVRGSGSPTVVLEAGLGADTHSWQDVQPHWVGARGPVPTTVPGSATASGGRGCTTRAMTSTTCNDCSTAPISILRTCWWGSPWRATDPPVRAIAPGGDRRAGALDAKGRDQMRRELAIWPKSQAPALRRSWARPVRDGVDLAAGDALASRVTSLGDTPLAVITAGTHKADSRGMPPPLARALYGLWVTMQDELAALSSDHVHVVAPAAITGSRSGASTAGTSGSTDSPTSSSAPWRRSSAPPATARIFRRAGVCSAAPPFAVAARRNQHAHFRACASMPEHCGVGSGRTSALPLSCSGRIAILLTDRDPGAALAQSRMSPTAKEAARRGARRSRAPPPRPRPGVRRYPRTRSPRVGHGLSGGCRPAGERRQASEEYPVPKLSSATRTPSARTAASPLNT